MPRLAAPEAEPELVEFHRTKYGRELLIDAGWVSGYRSFERQGLPHRLAFHDILLITRGAGRILLDVESHPVVPGTVLISRPGALRRWEVPHPIEGACVFFEEAFVSVAFADPRFLDQFVFFRPTRPTGALRLTQEERRQYLDRFEAMRREISALEDDSSEALRAVLYEFLVQLNRFYLARHGPVLDAASSGLVDRFVHEVERDCRGGCGHRRVADYAADLGVTPGHLNVLCRNALHTSAGAWIRSRITLEAQRLMLYTDLTAAQIGHRLGFDDPSYFSRFFRRETGISPTVFREARREGSSSQGGGDGTRP